jgi:hypothetical protein
MSQKAPTEDEIKEAREAKTEARDKIISKI